jgi:hypothetical protein
MDTVTDTSIPYAVQSFDALKLSPQSLGREAEGLLVAAIANLAVPSSISELTTERFQELRQSYSDIRIPFDELIRSLSAYARLGRQQSATAAEKNIQAAVAEYQRQMKLYRKTAYARKIDQWMPIAIQSVLKVLMVLATKDIQILLASTDIGIEIMKQGITSAEPIQNNENVLRMLCSLEKAVDKAAITDLI